MLSHPLTPTTLNKSNQFAYHTYIHTPAYNYGLAAADTVDTANSARILHPNPFLLSKRETSEVYIVNIRIA